MMFARRVPWLGRPLKAFFYPHRSYSTAFVEEWRKPFLERAGKLFRIIRIPVVASGIYSLGYHQGVIESHRHPQQFQEKLLDSILLDFTGIADRKDVEVKILTELDVQGKDGAKKTRESRYHQVAHVAKRIIDEARIHIKEELEESKEAVRSNNVSTQSGTSDGKQEMTLQELYDKDEKVQFWEAAKTRIEGDELNVDPWRFVFLSDAGPNAFVAEILPKRIFITTSLLEFAKSIDEVAFILGHEISHLILGHNSECNQTGVGLKTAEIVLLSIDPTAGILSFAFVALLDVARRCIEMRYSRDHEREADDLGLKLVSRCGDFDLQAGSEFMYRLNSLEGGKSIVPLLDSHPPSIDRAKALYKESKVLRQERDAQ